MNTTEQIAIMKVEARLANRADAEGLRNWTPEARAASLATRRARGSVWGWNHRQRAAPSTSEAFDRSMDAMTEDAEVIRRSQASGVPTISAPSKYAEQLAADRLQAFKQWLSEVKRTDDAIADFNEIVAVMGGLTSGIAKAQRGQTIGPVTADAAAEAAAKKAAIEKSIRRNFEKRNADYLRENPDERGIMLDMVAEKAEYYSASPAQKVEMEKDAYRQIRDSGSINMREPQKTRDSDYGTLLDAKRNYVRERDAVRPQLQPDEMAYPAGNGVWIGRLPNGDERVISAIPEPFVLPLKKPTPSSKAQEKLIDDREWTDTLQDGRFLIGGRYYDRIGNRHTASCAASQSPSDERVISAEPETGLLYNRWSPAARAASLAARRAKGSVWGWDKRKRATPDTTGTDNQQSAPPSAPSGNGKSMNDYIADGFSALDPDWAAKTVRRIEEREKWGNKLTTDEERLLKEYNAHVEEMNKKGGDGKEPVARVLESGVMTSAGPVKLSGAPEPEESEQWNNMVSGFKSMIGKGAKPTLANLQKQFEKDHDEEKFKLASAALVEAWHTHSLDKFQDQFERDPKNNSEFRIFQEKSGVPPEFIGGN